jgi:hypothetical protein
MLIKLKTPPSKPDIEEAIHTWLDLLAEERYTEAYTFTLHDSYNQWTPKLLESVINGYGLPYDESEGKRKCKVTSWSSAANDGSKYYKNIEFYDVPRLHSNPMFKEIGEIRYDLPVDGEWSDLTVTFKILQAEDCVTLELDEIHVF